MTRFKPAVRLLLLSIPAVSFSINLNDTINYTEYKKIPLTIFGGPMNGY